MTPGVNIVATMNKSYIFLLAALAIIVLAVGGYAFYRSNSASKNTTTAPSANPPAQTPTAPSQPSTAKEFDPSKNAISLTIASPTNNTTVSTPTITVTGSTAPNADVSVNDKDLKADAAGKFSAAVTLDEGDNEIIVTAADTAGNSSEQLLIVTYIPTQ